jgi:undecaprenyl pyrophosphate phosphatase UppP
LSAAISPGLNAAKAAEFSFLVGLPTLAGAAIYKAARSGPAMIEVFGWPDVLLGAGVAAVSALLAVKFLVHFISRTDWRFLPITAWLWPLCFSSFTCSDPMSRQRHNS